MKYIRTLTLLYLVLFCSSSNALLLTPDNYLDVYFSFDSQPNQNIDVFSYAIHGIDIQTQGLISTSLYDNDQFIASYDDLTQGFTRIFSFTSESSLYTFNDPTIIDFEPLLSGTINGMFRFSTDIGQFDIDPYFSNLSVGIATDYNSFTGNLSWNPNITSAVLTPKVVPEPPVIWLLILGLVLLFPFKQKRIMPNNQIMSGY